MSAVARPRFAAPLYLAWEVTLQCNARCLHCYSSSGPGVRHPNELTTAQAHHIIDQLADAGLLILAFSGGEPLVRPDIYDLMRHAADRELVVNVASNGAVVNDRTAARLVESGVRSVTVSLDGADAATHDHFRQFPGLFDRTLHAIDALVREGIRVVVSFTPTRLNHEHGRAVVRLAYDRGASAVNMSEYVPAGRGSTDLALPAELVRETVLDWIAMRREYAGRMQVIWHDCRVALLVPPEEQDRYSGCGAGKLTARLMADGTLTPCVFISQGAGNLRERSFADIWENAPVLRTIRDRNLLVSGNCGGCEYKQICGGCRATSVAFTGQLMGGDPSCWVVPFAASGGEA